jgi:tellurite resistance protein TerC
MAMVVGGVRRGTAPGSLFMDTWLWIGFTVFILLMLGLDLGLVQRRPHAISMKEALAWFAVWTSLALLFNIGIVLFHERGGQAGLEFFTGFWWRSP